MQFRGDMLQPSLRCKLGSKVAMACRFARDSPCGQLTFGTKLSATDLNQQRSGTTAVAADPQATCGSRLVGVEEWGPGEEDFGAQSGPTTPSPALELPS